MSAASEPLTILQAKLCWIYTSANRLEHNRVIFMPILLLTDRSRIKCKKKSSRILECIKLEEITVLLFEKKQVTFTSSTEENFVPTQESM